MQKENPVLYQKSMALILTYMFRNFLNLSYPSANLWDDKFQVIYPYSNWPDLFHISESGQMPSLSTTTLITHVLGPAKKHQSLATTVLIIQTFIDTLAAYKTPNNA